MEPVQSTMWASARGSDLSTAAAKPIRIPAGGAPNDSDSEAHNNRPPIAARLIQIVRYEAWAGVTFSTSTNNVTIHSDRPTPPVWLSPVRQLAAMLRGYLNNSSHEVLCGSGREVGRAIAVGSSCSAP